MKLYFAIFAPQNGSVVMFGRVASYKFVDSPTDGRYNLVLSQSQLDSACLYERYVTVLLFLVINLCDCIQKQEKISSENIIGIYAGKMSKNVVSSIIFPYHSHANCNSNSLNMIMLAS